MRRILWGIGLFAAGVAALPFLSATSLVVSASVHDALFKPASYSTPQYGVAYSSPVGTCYAPGMCSSAPTAVMMDVLINDVPATVPRLPTMIAQADPSRTKTDRPIPVEAFDDEEALDRKSPPAKKPAAPQIVLPAGPEMLAPSVAPDEAASTKRTELQETLRKVIEEKAKLLSADALDAEIEMHQRHLSDLLALQELLRLQHSLKELSDKYPNSDAGRRAGEVLKLLEQLQSPRKMDPFEPPRRSKPTY